MEGHAVIAKLDLESSLLEKMDWIARRKRGGGAHSRFILNSIFSSSRFYTGSRWLYCKCRVSENGESIILNLLIQDVPEILDVVLSGILRIDMSVI
jgi:hypothetical protein